MTHYSRADWGAKPGRGGPGSLVPANVDGIALHHHGGGPIAGKAHVIRALQGFQAGHLAKGWSDIAYQVAVDMAGNRWDLRGLGAQSAANGDQDVNRRFGAVLLIVGNDEQPSPAMVDEVRAVVRDFRHKFPGGRRIVGHRDVRPQPTACPGDRVMALIRAGAFEPAKQEEEDDMPSASDVWDVKEDKWQPGDKNLADKMPVRQQLNQARGYAEHASKRADAIGKRVDALDDKTDRLSRDVKELLSEVGALVDAVDVLVKRGAGG